MRNDYNSQLLFLADKLYDSHPQLFGRLMKWSAIFIAILNVLGICGGLALLFVGQWRLALFFLVVVFVGRFALGLAILLGGLIFALPALKLAEKGGFCRVLSVPVCFLAALFNGFLMWYFTMFLFQAALLHTEGAGMFAVVCAVLASYAVGTGVIGSMADKNSVVDNLNLIFYSFVVGLLCVLFICSVLTAHGVVFLCSVAVILKAIFESILLAINRG